MTDYCGHTELEANRALIKWLDKTDDARWTVDPSAVIETRECSASDDVDILHRWLTQSLDSCRLIERRLSREQLLSYMRLLKDASDDGLCGLILLDAPTRVRALLTVLGLGKAQSIAPASDTPDDITCCDWQVAPRATLDEVAGAVWTEDMDCRR